MARGLEAAAQAEPGFDPRAFVEGAKSAYEAIMIAFAKGDRKTLRGLLSKEVGEAFERAITERERLGIQAVWMQLGVIDETATGRARAAGLRVVVDACPRIEHPRLA